MENVNEEQWWEMSEKIHQVMEPTLEEIYAKWQSQPATEEQWLEMSEEIQWAMAKERKNFGIPEENEPPSEEEIQRAMAKERKNFGIP
jgi:hypothetical protein